MNEKNITKNDLSNLKQDIKEEVKNILDRRKKDFYSSRQNIREEIKNILDEREARYKEFEAILNPESVKSMVTQVVNFKIKTAFEDLKQDILQKFSSKIDKLIKIKLNEHIKSRGDFTDVIKQVAKDSFSDALSKRFEPIILNSIRLSNQHFTKVVHKKIQDIVNLKTSTIMDIKEHVSKESSITDEVFLKKIEEIDKLENFEGDKRYLEFFEEYEKQK